MIKKIIAFALLFSFIYQISYIFLPFNVPFVMGLIGMPIYLYKNFTFPLEDRKYVKDILLSLLPVAVVISDARLKALVKDKTTPKTRNEREIAGYRDVLNTIHESHDYISIRPNKTGNLRVRQKRSRCLMLIGCG